MALMSGGAALKAQGWFVTDGAPEALSSMPAHWNAEQHTEPMAAPRLRSLFECLGEVPEYRHARGKRYALNTILVIAVAARLAGYRGVNAFAQFAALLSQEQLEAVGAFWSPSKQRYTPPAITTFHKTLTALPPETLDNAISQWTGQHGSAHAPVAMDGKDLRGASKQTEDGRRMMVAAVARHRRGPRAGRGRRKSNEIPAVRELSSGLDLTGRIVTMDAMHAQHETARCLLGRRADYVMSAVKDNQEMIFEDLKAIDFSDALWRSTRAMAASSADAAPSSTSRCRVHGSPTSTVDASHAHRARTRDPQDRASAASR